MTVRCVSEREKERTAGRERERDDEQDIKDMRKATFTTRVFI